MIARAGNAAARREGVVDSGFIKDSVKENYFSEVIAKVSSCIVPCLYVTRLQIGRIQLPTLWIRAAKKR
jgi:hypothetical protein